MSEDHDATYGARLETKRLGATRAGKGKTSTLPPDWPRIWAGCLRRIRAWRPPPGWAASDWWEEVAAEAAIAALLAMADFDPSRGVPTGCYVRMRVLGHALARYRREWIYGKRFGAALPVDEPAEADDGRDVGPDGEGLGLALAALPDADRRLVRRLFWEGRSQAEVAREFGITQQAVSKRKRQVLDRLAESLPPAQGGYP